VTLGPREAGAQQRPGPRYVVRPVAAEVVRVAGQRRLAGADAARVEADPVVGVTGVVGHELAEDRQAQTRAAGPAGVDEHDALVPAVRHGVPDAGHRDLDPGAVRVVVVERYRQEPALRAGLGQPRVVAGT